jgi:hypothetical protein
VGKFAFGRNVSPSNIHRLQSASRTPTHLAVLVLTHCDIDCSSVMQASAAWLLDLYWGFTEEHQLYAP